MPQEVQVAKVEGGVGQQKEVSQAPNLGGLKPTANRTGFDFGQPTYGFENWIESYDGGLPLLDVGAGLGTNTLEALKQGAAVMALDPSADHLQKLKEKVSSDNANKLQTFEGQLPALRVLPSLASAALCAQVLHFLKPDYIPPAFKAMYNAIKPGGRLILTCASLYQLPEKGMIEAFEDSLLNANGAHFFPGWIEDSRQLKEMWSKKHSNQQTDQLQQQAMPDSFHVFHTDQIKHQAEQAGFVVEECSFVSGEACGMPKEMTHGGKEDVYLLAHRPFPE